MTPPVTDSDAGRSSASGSNVCRDFQKGSCPRKNCKFYHPPPSKPCHFEFQKKGSCTNGLQCRFSHQLPDGNGNDGKSPSISRPNLKYVDKTHKLRGTNLFWMKAANKAQQSRKLKGAARQLVTLDELSGKADAIGVDLIAGSLASDKKPKVPESKTFAEPNSIRLRGPLEKVKTIERILEKQETILEGMTKHEVRWLFSDDPWAKPLMETKFLDMTKIFNKGANDGYGWYEFIHNGKGKGASNKAGKQGAKPKDGPMQLLGLASTKINGIELQVAYAPNIVAAQVDAIIISCGPYMHMEDGVAQDITDWNDTSKSLALDAKKKKFGNGPLQASEFVAVSVPSDHPRGSSQKIFCSFLPPATVNILQNSFMIRKSMRNVMQHIAEHNASASTKVEDKIKTLALPLLGTGRYGHSPSAAAKDILAEVMAQLPHSGVKSVLFLDQRVEPLEALKSAVKNLADEVQGSHCKLQELPIKELIEPGWYYYVGQDEGGNNFANAKRNSAGMGDVIPDDKGAWFPLFPDVRERVEAAYQRWRCKPGSSEGRAVHSRAVPALPTGLPASMQSPASATVSFNVDNIRYPDGMVYEIAFDCSPMTQRNTKTDFKRKVIRKEKSYVWKKPDDKAIEKIIGKSAKKAAAEGQAAAAAKSAGRGEIIGILYQALDKASAEEACRMAKSEITSKFKVQSFCIPLPDHALSAVEEAEVQSMLSGIPVGLEIITGAESSNIKLTGLTEHLDLAKEIIVESTIYVSNSKFTYPSLWNSTQASQAIVLEVDATSGEFHDVVAKFVKDMPMAKVSKVERVQNDLLYKAYQGNFRILHERYTVNGMKLFKDADLTKELWHGTSGTSPETVALSAFGTERAYSSDRCMWGAGNYFSTTTSYSNNYAYKIPGTNSRQMVLFEVLTGLVFDSPPNNGLKKPPPLPSDHTVMAKFGSSAPPNLQYDSVTGITQNTRVYITYSTGVAQQYPHYIVTYEP